MTSADRAFYDAYYKYESADDYDSDDYPVRVLFADFTAEQVQDRFAELAALLDNLVIDVDLDTFEALYTGVAIRGAHIYDYPDEYYPDTLEERLQRYPGPTSPFSDEDDTELEPQTTVEKPTLPTPAAKTANGRFSWAAGAASLSSSS